MNRAEDAGCIYWERRFLYIQGQFNWRHLGEVLYLNPLADFVDCTDMTEKQLEAFTRVVMPLER